MNPLPDFEGFKEAWQLVNPTDTEDAIKHCWPNGWGLYAMNEDRTFMRGIRFRGDVAQDENSQLLLGGPLNARRFTERPAPQRFLDAIKSGLTQPALHTCDLWRDPHCDTAYTLGFVSAGGLALVGLHKAVSADQTRLIIELRDRRTYLQNEPLEDLQAPPDDFGTFAPAGWFKIATPLWRSALTFIGASSASYFYHPLHLAILRDMPCVFVYATLHTVTRFAMVALQRWLPEDIEAVKGATL